MQHVPAKAVRHAMCLLLFCACAALFTSFAYGQTAAVPVFPTATYDVGSLGVPKFVNSVYIDLRKVTRLSKFRSNSGHEYSDSSQFASQGYKDPAYGNRLEYCASMKHYFIAPDAMATITAPVSGIVSRMFDEQTGGVQLQITSEAQPAFVFIIFHVELTKPLEVGSRVTEGEVIGHHIGTQTWSDIAVFVNTPRGLHLISYFETLTDEAFAAFQARGIATREELILTRDYREAHPVFHCGVGKPIIRPEEEQVALTRGAATQVITTPTYIDVARVGDTAVSGAATATSGLPVTVTSLSPKVCPISGTTLSWRRPGRCKIVFTQDGNDDTFAAPRIERIFTVLPAGESLSFERPRLGGIHPPFTGEVQSYLRIFNQGYGNAPGTLTASLLDGDTGDVVARWTSPSIAPRAVAQFSISDLESAAPPGFIRPQSYGLRIENETTVAGYLQHVLFNSVTGGLTNASSCSSGMQGNPNAVPFIYSSLFADFPSTLVLANGSSEKVSYQLTTYKTDGGAISGLATFPFVGARQSVPVGADFLVTASDLETRISFRPGAAASIYSSTFGNYREFAGHVQHVVTNKRPNVISDMTVACDLGGQTNQTVLSPLFTSYVLSASPASGQSFFRFYNGGAEAGAATVTLRDPDTGGALGQWTTPSIAPGAEMQMPVSWIEDEPGFVRKSRYTATVETAIDGYFQHVIFRAPDGALSNLSTCAGAVTLDKRLLIGVHSSLVGRAGYPSAIVVNNMGTEAASAVLDIIDARDGRLLETFTTPSIPADAQARFPVSVIETSLNLTPGAGMGHYNIKLRSGFTGYLQHFVENQEAGVVTDLTAMCAM